MSLRSICKLFGKIYDISITYVFPSHVCMLFAGCGGFFLQNNMECAMFTMAALIFYLREVEC